MKYDITVKKNELILNRPSHLLFTITGQSIDLITVHFTGEDFTDRDPKSPSEGVTEPSQPSPSFVSVSLCCEREILTVGQTLKLYMQYLISFSQLSRCGRYYRPPFYRCKIQVSGRLDDLPKGLQLVNHGTRIQIHLSFYVSKVLFFLCHQARSVGCSSCVLLPSPVPMLSPLAFLTQRNKVHALALWMKATLHFHCSSTSWIIRSLGFKTACVLAFCFLFLRWKMHFLIFY